MGLIYKVGFDIGIFYKPSSWPVLAQFRLDLDLVDSKNRFKSLLLAFFLPKVSQSTLKSIWESLERPESSQTALWHNLSLLEPEVQAFSMFSNSNSTETSLLGQNMYNTEGLEPIPPSLARPTESFLLQTNIFYDEEERSYAPSSQEGLGRALGENQPPPRYPFSAW